MKQTYYYLLTPIKIGVISGDQKV